jgi:large subunit ribosomal protein L24
MADQWRLRKGDKVCVLAGKNKGETGTILKVLREKRRVVVQGVNLLGKHQKPSPQYPDGGVIRREAPLHASNVAHVDPETGKPTRVGIRFLEDGRKVRFAKLSGKDIDVVN